MDEQRGFPRSNESGPSESDPAARVGSTIRGKWKVDALIGSGGMAAVFAATHRNGQRAALKVLHQSLAHDPTVRDRFLREGYVTNSVGHPACVAVFDDDVTEEDAPFLVMELLEGETLRDLWKKLDRRVPAARALEIADPVLDCLAACHGAGVIHRDLKPPNVFLTRAGAVKVLDFGVAQLRSAAAEKTRAGTALGTPHYMSPEQAMGLVDQLDGRADLFSVGAILHAVVTGKRIHAGRTENEALIIAATTPVPSVARIAPELAVPLVALIDKALAWDRRNRFADAREMQLEVRRVLALLGGAASTPGAHRAPPPLAPGAPVSEREPEREPEPEELAVPDDPRVLQLQEVFKTVDRLLPNVTQLGWDHPAAARALRFVFDAVAAALAAEPDLFVLTVRPYSLLLLGQSVWEPSAPYDVVPYNLFACGMRSLRLLPGVSLEELQQLLRLLTLDPRRDLAPEDDIVAALWDLGLPHVRWETVDWFAEGGAAEREGFFAEADDLERAAAGLRASGVEARAMALTTDRRALEAGGGSRAMALGEAARASLAAQLRLPREQWSERYVQALAEGLLDADERGDVAMVLSSLRASASDLLVVGKPEVALALHDALRARLGPSGCGARPELLEAVSSAMFGGETLSLLLVRAREDPALSTAVERALERVSALELGAALAALGEPQAEPVRAALLGYVTRVLPGSELAVAEAAATMAPAGASALIALLEQASTIEARRALEGLKRGPSPLVRVQAAFACGDGSEAVVAELGHLCSDGAPEVRRSALRFVAARALRAALPALVRIARAPSFTALGVEERREVFAALLAAGGERAESMTLEVARKAGMFSSEPRELSRVAAVQALGAVSRSREVAAALREMAAARWGTSDEARLAATAAAHEIESRIAPVSRARGSGR